MTADHPEFETVSLPTEDIGQFVLANAHEHHSVWEVIGQPEDPSWRLCEAEVEDVDLNRQDGDHVVVVHATAEDSESVQTSAGSFCHPPEYKNYDVTVRLTVEWHITGNNGLGEFRVYGECEGGAPSPPDPEPEPDI